MKRLVACGPIIAALALFCPAQSLLNIGIGPTWPKVLRGTDKATAWNATIEFARIFDDRIGLGMDVDFLWNSVEEFYDTYDTTEDQSGTPTLVSYLLKKEKRLMFPLSLFLSFDPVPHLIVHPVVRGQIGFNMMTYNDVDYRDTSGERIPEGKRSIGSGFYIGVVGKTGADAVYDLGEHAAVFLGFEYQWSTLRKKRSNKYTWQEMNAPCFRMGLSFLF